MTSPEAEKDVSRPANRHALTATERQRVQLDKLLKDPSKPAHIPTQLKDKTIRPPREMMKNVQGSSAGAGSGEFHVYKASRRREYERLNLLEEQSRKEIEAAEFERRRKEAEAIAEAKTAKNRAKRQKKKERLKTTKSSESKAAEGGRAVDGPGSEVPFKKRRLINGRELVFKRHDGEDESEDDDEPQAERASLADAGDALSAHEPQATAVESSRVVIHDD
ncbi:hypothetical protein E1B28_000549 [Marasmius oreades]|uniref:DUF1168-domain-containing protein n=1 Tax=Marasmius oreades TaxID=181124 RepID=A0A9P7V1I5_9AGAR|nr:uncharacterized protein E1B28_000549 [Marasmius oreades]KAG7098631.1 hypothetical protein E1B28_000549 [Marasmius oreades]